MEVITSHTNADFDNFASMIAAKKLYPEAHLAFSGSLERKLRDALKTLKVPHRFEKAASIDLEKIRTLILVDVRGPSRIGPFGSVVGRKGVKVHIYDHHPPSEADIKGDLEVIRPYGSTTTVLTHIIKERSIKLTPVEATILMAGIYEDTGSLTYPSTTTKDYEAAAHLLSSGADLNTVSELLKDELTPEEVSLLNEFLQTETTYTMAGVDVVVVEGHLEKYGGDISGLAHRIRDIEGMEALFMLVDSGDRVHLVARSAIPEVNAGSIARILGGGGHPNAASATMKGVTLIEAREKLLAALKKKILPEKTASDIMSFPPITVPPETSIKSAVDLMLRYNINAMPVVRKGALAGVITRQVVEKAAYHGLGGAPVSELMTLDVEHVGTSTSVDEIREKVIGRGQRLLPVLRGKEVAGVITRTDLLKLLQEELEETPGLRGRPGRAGGPGGRGGERARNLRNVMKERLPGWLFSILEEIGRSAEEMGVNAYAVGGFVRDQILRRENLDVDIVIEGGDGVAFAREFGRERGLRVRAHERFKTAVMIFPDGFKIDVATARLEYYERPGSLPTIEQSSLKLDLYRRDFIINTLAVCLNRSGFGRLIDFFGAEKDLKDRKIRVLHNLSFVEDPTRALRAVRFSEKFGFDIERHTLTLIKSAVKLGIFERLSGARLLDELRSVLEEETSTESVERLAELGLLRYVHEEIRWDDRAAAVFESTREALIWYRLLYRKETPEEWLTLFLALTTGVEEPDLKGLAKRLSISGKKRLFVLASRRASLLALEKIESGVVKRNSELYDLLSPLPLETLIYMMARAGKEASKKAISNYITTLRDAGTVLGGDDLLKMGVPQGELVGEVLDAVLHARLDGELETRDDEVAFVESYLETAGK